MAYNSTTKAEIVSHQCCVLYDGKTGAIRHLHQDVTLKGGAATPKDELPRRAMEVAEKAGVKTKGLLSLHVDPQTFERGRRYSVDLKRKAVIAEKVAKSAKKSG